jgi:glutamate racemase
MASDASKPIAVFDSGLGGLTVVRDLLRLLPGENIVYLGDSARVPYGIKSLETIRRFALEDAAFLQRFDPKLMVVACNTASAAAIDALEKFAACPVIDVVRPSAAEAIRVTMPDSSNSAGSLGKTAGSLGNSAGDSAGPAIGVVATEATVRSGAYQRALRQADPTREVLAVPCPLLVPIVEEGRPPEDPIIMHVLCDYLRDLQRLRPGALILGCTHYPLLAGEIGKLMGPTTQLVSSGAAAAAAVGARLDELHLRNRQPEGRLEYFTTDNPTRFAELAERFGGRPVQTVEYIGTDELEQLNS